MDLLKKSVSLDFSHQNFITETLNRLNKPLSEYTFSNLYLFRKIHEYNIIVQKNLFIQGLTYDGMNTLMPLFDLNSVKTSLLYSIGKQVDCFYPICKTDLQYFPEDLFVIDHNPDDSDYIFSLDKLSLLEGRHLSPKRNLISQFLRVSTPEVRPLNSKNKHHAISVLKQWLRDVDKDITETDFNPCLEALNHLEELDLFGQVTFDSGNPIGFLIAKHLNTDSCILHFAKGIRAIKGVYPYMFQKFAQTYVKQFKNVNFEQDLGNVNFRKTKQSYHPETQLIKYRIRRK